MKKQIEMIKNECKNNLPDFFNEQNITDVKRFHESLPIYEKTPLIDLRALSDKLDISQLYIKDESKRFGLNAFKGLGASYAINKLYNNNPGETKDLVTATDGNHGRAVAWAARQYGLKAYVFMPKGSSDERADAIRNEGAEVEITQFNYADAVRYASSFADKNGYHLVQDTAFQGYDHIPDLITLGYTTMVDEAIMQIHENNGAFPTHVVIQAGVGSVAGAVTGYFAIEKNHDLPVIIIVEPTDVACIYESVKNKHMTVIDGNPTTDMAGLNCGEPNPNTLPIIEEYASYCVKCPDWVTWDGMRQLANPSGGDPQIVSGESGAVGLGFINEICSNESYSDYKKQLDINSDSSILVFSTEGATDKENYNKIVYNME